jgi:hypothetical protein
MNNLLIALAIGLAAGIIDVVPMIIMKLEKRANIAAFLHYFFLGIIIPFIDFGLPGWLTGIIVAVMVAIPTMIVVYPDDKKAFIPMIAFALLLGAGIGWAGEIFIF